MLTPQEYFWSSLLFLLIFGAVLYVVDRVFGVAVKRWFWSLTHDKRTRLPKDEEQGFIYRRHARSRFNVALVIMVIETALSIAVFRYNPLLEILSAVLDLPVLMIGFYLGPLLDMAFGHVDRGLDRIENLEERIDSGKTTLSGEVTGAFRNAGTRVRETVYPDSKSKEPQEPSADKSPEKPGQEEPDPKTSFDDFIGRKK